MDDCWKWLTHWLIELAQTRLIHRERTNRVQTTMISDLLLLANFQLSNASLQWTETSLPFCHPQEAGLQAILITFDSTDTRTKNPEPIPLPYVSVQVVKRLSLGGEDERCCSCSSPPPPPPWLVCVGWSISSYGLRLFPPVNCGDRNSKQENEGEEKEQEENSKRIRTNEEEEVKKKLTKSRQ